jgi:hypothetical protein
MRLEFAALCVLLLVAVAADGQPAMAWQAAPDAAWQVDLVDGGRIVGPVATETLEIVTEFGTLRVPVDKLTEFTPGFVSRPELLRRVDASIAQLGDDKAQVREQAERELGALGPRIAELLQAAGKDEDLERRQRAKKLVAALGENKSVIRAWPRHDTVVAAGQRFAGKIATREIAIKAAWGTVTVPLAEIESFGMPASRKIVDLLAEIDVGRDAVVGEWTWDGTALVSPRANRTRLQIPYDVPAEYELRLKVQPVSGRVLRGAKEETADSLFLGIFIAGRAANLAIDAFRDIGGPFTGFDLTDGKRVASTPLHKGEVLRLGHEVELVVQVRRDSVVFEADKKQIFAWQGDPARLATSSQWLLRDSRYLGIGAHQTTYKIREFRLTPIDDAPTPENLKPGDWAVRLRDGSLLVGRPIEKQTLTLREAGGSEPQSLPVDMIASMRLSADGKNMQIESAAKTPWSAKIDETLLKATVKFHSRFGEIGVPLGTVREASVAGSAETAEEPAGNAVE